MCFGSRLRAENNKNIIIKFDFSILSTYAAVVVVLSTEGIMSFVSQRSQWQRQPFPNAAVFIHRPTSSETRR